LVERNLAKVEVESSRLFSRSSFPEQSAVSDKKVALEIQAVSCYNVGPNAGVAQLVERNLAKVEVESSRLFSRSIRCKAMRQYGSNGNNSYAGVAQLVERNLAKVEVESSRLFSRSRILAASIALDAARKHDRSCAVVPRKTLWRGSKEVMQRPAKPSRSVRFRSSPPEHQGFAAVRGKSNQEKSPLSRRFFVSALIFFSDGASFR
jgi:hypothetical protein